jgi:hypothetical protein
MRWFADLLALDVGGRGLAGVRSVAIELAGAASAVDTVWRGRAALI